MNLALQSVDCIPQSATTLDQTGRDGLLVLDRPLELARGGRLNAGRLAYRIEGPSDAPVVLVMGGVSANREVAGEAGWWPGLAGPGKVIDTRGLRILSFDWLGGLGRSTRAEDAGFPVIDTRDQAEVARLLLDHLDIRRLHAVIGASYGGLVAQQLARLYPQRVRRAVVLGAGHRPFATAAAPSSIQRRILRDGTRRGQLAEATALAGRLATVSDRSSGELEQRFDGATAAEAGAAQHPVDGYLGHCGERSAERFGAWVYPRLSESIDLHHVDPEHIEVPTDLVAFSDDQIAPLGQLREFKQRQGAGCRLWLVPTDKGHDGFLTEVTAIRPILSRALERTEEQTPC